MFKEKLYTGTLSEVTATEYIKELPTSTVVSCFVSQTDLLNNCIVDFLINECGLTNSEVRYYTISGSSDDRKGSLYLFGSPIQFTIYNNTNHGVLVYFNGNSMLPSNSPAKPFSGNSYNFKIGLVGNPKCGFTIWVSNYDLTWDTNIYGSAPSGYNVDIYRLKDINGRYYLGVVNYRYTNIYVNNSEDGSAVMFNGSAATTFSSRHTGVGITTIQGFDYKYPLIPARIQAYYEFINGYELVGALTNLGLNSFAYPSSPNFIKIGNDTYCMLSDKQNILVKL